MDCLPWTGTGVFPGISSRRCARGVCVVDSRICALTKCDQNCVLVIVECPRNEEANVDQLQSWQDGLMALSLGETPSRGLQQDRATLIRFAGSLRFAFVKSTRDVVRTVLKVRSSMSQPQKLALQKQYFRQQLDALVSSSTARSVLTEALARMAIPEAGM